MIFIRAGSVATTVLIAGETTAVDSSVIIAQRTVCFQFLFQVEETGLISAPELVMPAASAAITVCIAGGVTRMASLGITAQLIA